MFKFNSIAEQIKKNTIKMMDNHVIPSAKVLDAQIAVAVPTAQVHAAAAAMCVGEQAKSLHDLMFSVGKRLNDKAAENLKAVEKPKTVKVSMTQEQFEAWQNMTPPVVK